MNYELSDIKAGFKKAEEPEIKLLKSTASLKEQESLRKNIYFCFIDSAKFLTVQIKTNWSPTLSLNKNDMTKILRNYSKTATAS